MDLPAFDARPAGNEVERAPGQVRIAVPVVFALAEHVGPELADADLVAHAHLLRRHVRALFRREQVVERHRDVEQALAARREVMLGQFGQLIALELARGPQALVREQKLAHPPALPLGLLHRHLVSLRPYLCALALQFREIPFVGGGLAVRAGLRIAENHRQEATIAGGVGQVSACFVDGKHENAEPSVSARDRLVGEPRRILVLGEERFHLFVGCALERGHFSEVNDQLSPDGLSIFRGFRQV